MTLIEVRVAAGVLAALALALAFQRRRALARHLRAFFLEPSPPERLALVRIALFGALSWVSFDTKAVWWAAQPADLRVMPRGWGWVVGVLPIDATSASVAQAVTIGASLCATVGLATRITAPIAALAAVFLLGTPSFFGKVLHLDHALVLMTLVMSVSACADAWSVDRWIARRAGRPAPGSSAAYTLPMRLCWLLLGTVYLFPGLWKIWDNGDLWLNGQRLLWELNDEWGQRKYLDPPMRIDRYPWL
jgi:hypothetical protein